MLEVAACGFAADFEPPSLVRLHPLGGRAGSVVELEILGTKLDAASGVEFDCKEIVWEQTTLTELSKREVNRAFPVKIADVIYCVKMQ